MDISYVSAFFGLAGATVGGLTSFATAWMTQHSQMRDRRREAARIKREELFGSFITEASRLYGDALSRERDDLGDLVQLYALVARMRLLASAAVVAAAESVLSSIVATYLSPNLTLQDLQKLKAEGGMNFLLEFGEACRQELARI
jgi:hypothetical protein